MDHAGILDDLRKAISAGEEVRKKSPFSEGFTSGSIRRIYFCVGAGCEAGAAGGCAGVAGCEDAGEALTPESTEFAGDTPLRRTAKIERVIEVIMKRTADQVVALDRAVAAPRGPNAVWLPMPPNAAAISPLLPLCSSTTTIRKKQTKMCKA